jgi:hypothetical protein
LASLHLNRCNLTVVPPIFKELKQLTSLFLAGNLISYIDIDTFLFAPRLQILDLSENPLVFTLDMFVGLDSLETLLIAEVGITDIPRDALTSLRNLRNLILDRNSIKELNATSFHGLPKFKGQFFSFVRNGLTKITADAVRKLPRPFELKLDSNLIGSLDFLYLDESPCAFEGSDISLVKNPIHCDCDLYDELKYQVVTVLGSCASPKKYRGLDLHYVPVLENTPFAGKPFLKEANLECQGENPGQRYDCKCDSWLKYDEYRARKNQCLFSSAGNFKSGVFLVFFCIAFSGNFILWNYYYSRFTS